MQMQRKSEGADAKVVQNAAKTLYANIRFASVDHPIKVVMLTSSVPNEGKTTVAYNLAVAVASGGKRVLLVECDMRRRSIADSIGARARYGIYSVLSHQVELSQAVVATQQANLFFLDAEPNIPNPADIISSHRFRDLIATMKASYDFVIVDTPPVGTFVDAAILSTLVDGTAMWRKGRVCPPSAPPPRRPLLCPPSALPQAAFPPSARRVLPLRRGRFKAVAVSRVSSSSGLV